MLRHITILQYMGYRIGTSRCGTGSTNKLQEKITALTHDHIKYVDRWRLSSGVYIQVVLQDHRSKSLHGGGGPWWGAELVMCDGGI